MINTRLSSSNHPLLADNDIGKHLAGIEHVATINNYLKKNIYKFTILTPKSFDAFFGSIKNNTFEQFNSELDVEINKIYEG